MSIPDTLARKITADFRATKKYGAEKNFVTLCTVVKFGSMSALTFDKDVFRTLKCIWCHVDFFYVYWIFKEISIEKRKLTNPFHAANSVVVVDGVSSYS